MNNYKLTIIMSNYNQAELLPKAIKSILSQQTTFDYKIIITDDNSTKDNSVEVINSFTKDYPNIEAIFAKNNKGYLTNVLRAKKITKTKYFCLLDADDYWTDVCWLQKAYDFLEKHDDYVIYESNVLIVSDNKKDGVRTFINRKVQSQSFDKHDMFTGRNIPITQTTGQFYRNVIFKHGVPTIMENAIGTLSERSFEGDTDRFIMHLKYGKAFYKDDVVGVYRWSENGIWARLRASQKELIAARSYMDYYEFYDEHIEYFVTEAWNHLEHCLLELAKEINSLTENIFFDSKEYQNYASVYKFCCTNKRYIVNTRKSIKEKIKRIVKAYKIAFEE